MNDDIMELGLVPVLYKGANYMCVKGSDRARFLTQANAMWLANDPSEREVWALAVASPGCGFEARTESYSDHCIAEASVYA